MGEVVPLDCVTKLDLPADRVLTEALTADLEGVVVCGYTKSGAFYAASSYADGGDALWALEMCKRKLFDAVKELGG